MPGVPVPEGREETGPCTYAYISEFSAKFVLPASKVYLGAIPMSTNT
jgi:hypothetical protein